MQKQQLLNRLDKAWLEFCESFAGLSESQITKSGVNGVWSIKDVIAHVTTWEEEALKHLPDILKGIRPQRYSVLYGGIHAFNAKMTENKQKLSLSEVRHQMEQTHRQLVEYIWSAPDELFSSETRFRRRIRLDTYSHYPKHTQAIRSWLERERNH